MEEKYNRLIFDKLEMVELDQIDRQRSKFLATSNKIDLETTLNLANVLFFGLS
jgi:hypothetical protein